MYTLHLQVMRLENVGLRTQASWNTDSSTILALLKGLSNEIFAASLLSICTFYEAYLESKLLKNSQES